MLTEDIIRNLAPKARDDYASALVAGAADLEAGGINTPPRLTALLATICHETGGLTIVRENMHYSAERIKQVWPTRPEAVKFAGRPRELANCVYNGRMGNRPGTDDGWNFRGGGMLQTTGRDNYEAIGKAIGVDLGNQPDLIEDARISLKAAVHELGQFLVFCDRGQAGWRAVCNGVNRGNALSKLDPIGWVDRQQWYSRCLAALGASGAVDDTLNFGDQGPMVKALQERLAVLGYASGRADGVFGSRTRAAVLAFQAENHLQTSGEIGPEGRAALNSSTAKPMPIGERGAETAKDLAAAGSTTIDATQKIKAAALAVATVSGVTGGAQQSGVAPAVSTDLIAVTKDTVTEVGSWKVIINAMAETFAWATSHWWILGIVAGFAFYRWAGTVEKRRVLAHQLGLDLSK
jgi:predicted chitinase